MRMKVLAGLSLASFLCAQSLPEIRMLPAEMRGGAVDGNQIGSSGLAGVHTKVLFGDPSKAGFYSILLFVGVLDAHFAQVGQDLATKIEAIAPTFKPKLLLVKR